MKALIIAAAAGLAMLAAGALANVPELPSGRCVPDDGEERAS